MTLQPVPPDRRRPTRADQRAYERLQATALDRALADAQVWRNGYALLGSGVGAVLALVGTRLDNDTAWAWRLALTFTLGGGLLFVANALWMTLTVEGGKRGTSLNLQRIVQQHNSFELYQADQAAAAIKRIDRSKGRATIGGVFCFLGLLCTLWIASPSGDAVPGPSTSPAPSASILSQTADRPVATPIS